MHYIIAFSLLILSVTCEYERRNSFFSEEEMDNTVVPADDPIWWFVRSPAEELWLSEVIMEYPQTNMFGEEVPNMLQFILLGEPDDVNLILTGCPLSLYRELMQIRDWIVRRHAIRYLNNVRQSPRSAGFHLNHFFENDCFADE